VAPLRLGQKLRGWLLDYGYVAYWTVRGLLPGPTADHYLRPAHPEQRNPVLLIPGVFENWRFMQPVAEHLFGVGHPVHVLAGLGYNTGSIPDMAAIARQYLQELDLREVVIVAHSKGGLIGKHALLDPATLGRVQHLIAINTPYAGSRYASLFLLRNVRMFAPSATVISELQRNLVVNSRISSLYSVFDPHIPETGWLDGAENIVLSTVGHFRPIGAPETLAIISGILRRDS
jgi:triacylglycerol lipase